MQRSKISAFIPAGTVHKVVYEEGLDIPPHEETVSENLSKEVFFIPFDFLGITDGGWFFFYVPTEKGYLIQMVQPNGQKILKRSLPVDHIERILIRQI